MVGSGLGSWILGQRLTGSRLGWSAVRLGLIGPYRGLGVVDWLASRRLANGKRVGCLGVVVLAGFVLATQYQLFVLTLRS